MITNTGEQANRVSAAALSGAEHMVENRVAGVNVNDTLDVFCVITGVDSPNNGTVLWQVAVKDYTINVVPADLSQGVVGLYDEDFHLIQSDK